MKTKFFLAMTVTDTETNTFGSQLLSCIYGPNSAGREKKCLKCHQLTCTPRVAKPKRLVQEPCPSSILIIYGWRVSDRIFTFLECQETCAGNGEIPGKSRKSIFSKNVRKTA